MTGKEYVDQLTWQEFEQVKAFMNSSPDFFQFLTGPCKDIVTVANFGAACRKIGIPNNLTATAEALHYLVVAISNRAYGK